MNESSDTFLVSKKFEKFSTSTDYISILLILDPILSIKINSKEINIVNKCVIATGSIRSIEVENNEILKDSYIVQINSVKCNIDLTDLYLNNIILDYFDNYYLLPLDRKPLLYQVEGTLSEIESEYKNNELLTEKMIGLVTERFFIKFLRFYLKEKPKTTKSLQNHVLAEFIKLVNIHFREKKKLVEYADILNISTKTLSNLFTDSDLQSPAQIIKNRVIKEAKTLAINIPSISGKEVAFKLGYDNPNNFFVLFKNKEGLSFTAYAKKIR